MAGSKITICVDASGEKRALPEDYSVMNDLRELGFPPVTRASHVEMITGGPFEWWWLVDLSPSGPDFAFCLWPPAPTRESALAQEHEYIRTHWLEKTDDPSRLNTP